MASIPTGKLVAADTETMGLMPWHGDRPFAFSFCNSEGDTGWIRWEVDPFTREVQIVQDEWEELKAFFEDPTITKVFFHGQFDIRMLEAIDIYVKGSIHEVMYAMHAVNSDEPSFKLKVLGAKYCDIPRDDEDNLKKAVTAERRKAKKLGWKIHKKVECDYWLGPLDLVEAYGVGDAERTMLLWLMCDEAMDELEVRDAYNMEMRLFPITYAMETRGASVDPKVVRQRIREFEQLKKESAKRLKTLAPYVANLNSPPQLRRFIYGKKKQRVAVGSNGNVRTKDTCLGFFPTNFTKTGLPSTDIKALKPLRTKHPFIDELLKHRAYEKMLSTYFRKYEHLAVADPLNPGGVCIHTEYRQTAARTARYSSANPNLQNVPAAIGTVSTVALHGRDPFQPRPGFIWFLFDYSQLEIRIYADLSQEPFLLEALHQGRDLHTECANKAWGGKRNKSAVKAAIEALELDPIHVASIGKATDWLHSFNYDIVAAEASLDKSIHRKRAKLLFFGKLYGGGPNAVSDLLECGYDEASNFIADYDHAFPEMRHFMARVSKDVRRHGYIETAFGRKLMVATEAAYKGVNYRVQGSAADLLKDRTIAVCDWLKKRNIPAYPVLTVHDELVIEIAVEWALPWVVRRIKRIMEDHGGRFGIPLPVSVAWTSTYWSDKKPYERRMVT